MTSLPPTRPLLLKAAPPHSSTTGWRPSISIWTFEGHKVQPTKITYNDGDGQRKTTPRNTQMLRLFIAKGSHFGSEFKLRLLFMVLFPWKYLMYKGSPLQGSALKMQHVKPTAQGEASSTQLPRAAPAVATPPQNTRCLLLRLGCASVTHLCRFISSHILCEPRQDRTHSTLQSQYQECSGCTRTCAHTHRHARTHMPCG